MKKTLFLSAILGAALCSTTMGAVQTISNNAQTGTFTLSVGDMLVANAGSAKFYATVDSVQVNGNADMTKNSWGAQFTIKALTGEGDLHYYGFSDDNSTAGWVKITDGSAYTGKLTLDVSTNGTNAQGVLNQNPTEQWPYYADSSIGLQSDFGGTIELLGASIKKMNTAAEYHNEYALLALNASSVAMKGLAGNSLGYVHGGDVVGGWGTNPPSRANAVELHITGNGNESFAGTFAEGVSLVIDNGAAQTLNGATFSKVITNNGTLTFTGDNHLVGMTIKSTDYIFSETTEAEATATGNGYVLGTRTYHIVDGSGTVNTDGTTTFTDGTFTGSTYANGDVVLEKHTVDGGVYYVNSGTVEYTNGSAIASAATTAIQSAAGTTIAIGDGAVLSRANLTANGATKLSGSGTYAVTSASLGTNVSLDTTWAGTVRLTGATGNKNLGWAGNNIEMYGVTGWGEWKAKNTQNILLTDNGTTAAWTYGAFSQSTDNVCEYSGDWSGNGTYIIQINETNKQSRVASSKFTGDISAWTGELKVQSNNNNSTATVTFASTSDMAVNAKMTQESGKLAMVANTNVTFSKAIVADSLTLSAEKTVNLSNQSDTINTLTVNGRLEGTNSLKFNSLTLASGATFVRGITTIVGGTDSSVTASTDAVYDIATSTASINNASVSITGTEDTQLKNKLTNVALTYTGTSASKLKLYNVNTLTDVTTKDNTALEISGGTTTINGTATIAKHLQVMNGAKLQLGSAAKLNVTNVSSWNGLWLAGSEAITLLADETEATQGAALNIGGITIAAHNQTNATISAGDSDAEIGGSYNSDIDSITVADADITVNAGTNSLYAFQTSGGSVTVNSGTTTNIKSALSDTTTLTVNSGSIATFSGNASVASVAGAGSLNLSHNLTVAGNAAIGSLTLSNGANLTAETIGGAHNGTITLTSLNVTADGSELNANLVVNGGTITFADNTTLTMGCSVSIGTTDTVTVVLTQDMVDAVATTGRYDLFTSVETATLGNIVFVAADGVTLNDSSAYSLQWDGNKIYVAPEPATATLSLLALAALCARRKRH